MSAREGEEAAAALWCTAQGHPPACRGSARPTRDPGSIRMRPGTNAIGAAAGVYEPVRGSRPATGMANNVGNCSSRIRSHTAASSTPPTCSPGRLRRNADRRRNDAAPGSQDGHLHIRRRSIPNHIWPQTHPDLNTGVCGERFGQLCLRHTIDAAPISYVAAQTSGAIPCNIGSGIRAQPSTTHTGCPVRTATACNAPLRPPGGRPCAHQVVAFRCARISATCGGAAACERYAACSDRPDCASLKLLCRLVTWTSTTPIPHPNATVSSNKFHRIRIHIVKARRARRPDRPRFSPAPRRPNPLHQPHRAR